MLDRPLRALLRFSPRVLPLPRVPRTERLLLALRGRPGLCALDSAAGWPRRWSLVAADPLREPGGGPLEPPQRLAELGLWMARLAAQRGDALPGPFAGGFLGALAYDLGLAGERQELPRDPWGGPLIAGGLYVDYVVIEHGPRGAPRAAWLVLGEEPGDARASVAERRALWLDAIERALAPRLPSPRFEALEPPRRLVSRAEHCARIALARASIARGDFYQVNLAHPFECEVRGDPLALYLRLRRANPAPYMGYLDFGAGTLLSASPELLLELEGGRARTRPIKGTSARSADPAEDRRRGRELLASEKDRAELAMIVDLERNDLGRVARVGSVAVEHFPALRSYANVHHLTADVRCELAPGATALDALACLFPGGSISGAPKLAAMRAIAELEGVGRGFYTGAFGALDLAGRALFNVLIRSLVHRARPERGAGAGELRFWAGGGITWSSIPEREDEETLLKAARLAEAVLGGRRGRARPPGECWA